jgi:hypothetical protein
LVRPSQPSSQRGERQVAPETPRIRQTPAARTPAPEIRRESTVSPRVQSGPGRSQRPVIRDTPFRGIDEGSFERRAGERGGTSNRGNIMRQQSGGSRDDQLQQRQGGSGSSGRGSGGGASGGSGSRGGDSRR